MAFCLRNLLQHHNHSHKHLEASVPVSGTVQATSLAILDVVSEKNRMSSEEKSTPKTVTVVFVCFLPKVNAVNCNTSWKITLFMKFSSYRDDVLKGVSMPELF